MKKHIKIIVISLLAASILAACNRQNDFKDKRGLYCQNVIEAFIKACKAKKYQKALACWTPESKEVMDRIYGDYKKYFDKFAVLSEIKYDGINWGKSSDIKFFIIRGISADYKIWRMYIYVKQINGIWTLYYSDPVKEATTSHR
jgi:hypothetical protein